MPHHPLSVHGSRTSLPAPTPPLTPRTGRPQVLERSHTLTRPEMPRSLTHHHDDDEDSDDSNGSK